METTRIDLQTMVYKITRQHGRGEWPSVTVGTCKVVQGLSVDPVLAETRVTVLRCGGLYGEREMRFNPASYMTQFGQCRLGRCQPQRESHAIGDLHHYIEFRIDNDPSWKMRIDWREQKAYSDYFITQQRDGKTETVDAGFCRERP